MANSPQDGSLGHSRLSALAAAAFAYFGSVFCVAFVVGVLRVLIVAPMIGELSAVSLEAPIMLAVSWVACGWCLTLFPVAPAASWHLAMGGIAFALLMAAEFGLAALLFSRAPITALQTWATPAGAVGLASQIAFAAVPVLHGRFARPRGALTGTRGE